MRKLNELRRELTSEPRLRETIERLRESGELTADEAERLAACLAQTLQDSQYILRHFGAHLAIGAIFSYDIVPLPLGSMSRAAWVAAHRIYESIRRRPERASVHSLVVLGVSAIPFAGYLAYLIPLRARSAEAAYVYANHVTYFRSGCSFRAYLDRKPAWFARFVRRLVGTPQLLQRPAPEAKKR